MMALWQKVKDFWIRSYVSDRRAFYYETVASICVFISMTWIAVMAYHPPMHLIYPISFVGAVFSVAAFRRRGVAWPLVMTSYFGMLHIFGFGRALTWW
jgi:hypothetical protein